MALAVQVAAALHRQVLDVSKPDPRVGEEELRITGSSQSPTDHKTHRAIAMPLEGHRPQFKRALWNQNPTSPCIRTCILPRLQKCLQTNIIVRIEAYSLYEVAPIFEACTPFCCLRCRRHVRRRPSRWRFLVVNYWVLVVECGRLRTSET